MNKVIEKELNALFIDEEAKNCLRTIDRIFSVKSGSKDLVRTALLVTAGDGCGVSSYGKVYSLIVDSSPCLKVRGSESFLELVFPKDSEKEERLFFASPRRIASIRNRFYGTMLISFREYSGKDLLCSDSFNRLLNFISENRNNIHFVFHVLPEFSAKKQLLLKMKDVVNIMEVQLDKPTLDNGFAYVVAKLEECGYEVLKGAKTVLKEEILPDIISDKYYMGYRSLNALVERIHFEIALVGRGCEIDVSESILISIMKKYKEENTYMEVPKFGFSM